MPVLLRKLEGTGKGASMSLLGSSSLGQVSNSIDSNNMTSGIASCKHGPSTVA